MRGVVSVAVITACAVACAVGGAGGALAQSAPCWTRNWQWNSDGAGFEPDTKQSFSTSQNAAWDYGTTNASFVRSRYQITKWYFPEVNGKYRETRHDWLLVYDGVQLPDGSGVRYEWDEVNGTAVNCVAYGGQPFLDASCAPGGWVPWVGSDTFSIADVNTTTWCPPEERNEFLPDKSLLITSAPGQSTNVLAQLRIRQNGHYLLLLSVENWIGGDRLDLSIPTACQGVPLQPQPQPVQTLFYPPFWAPVYPKPALPTQL